jgi:predicted ATPase with chaperone activity
MSTSETQQFDSPVLARVLADENFWPSEPDSLEETGLTETFVESLIFKYLLVLGTASGRGMADRICLPFGVLEPFFSSLRARQLIVHAGPAAFNDYYYSLTEAGRQQAQGQAKSCAYTGPAPVPLMDYVISVEAQAIRAEAVRRDKFELAFQDISVNSDLFSSLGPAVNSGAGMFLYGAPGNGKSTLARRITMCFGQAIWLPHAIIEDGQIVKLFDASYHAEVKPLGNDLPKRTAYDRRWIKVRRPTVVVGGELTMDALEIRHDARSNVSEAPLQMKSNCGCLLIDDFGRQRIAPAELLNRWIVPLESHHDFLTLSTGKKIQVPFEQLILFSTNLEPADLVDEAFLRRIPYKIEISDPDLNEFYYLFELHAISMGIECRRDDVEYLIAKHYLPYNRAMRRCHPRDLLQQVRNFCVYNDLPIEVRPEHFDRVIGSYFATVLKAEPSLKP